MQKYAPIATMPNRDAEDFMAFHGELSLLDPEFDAQTSSPANLIAFQGNVGTWNDFLNHYTGS